MYCITDVSLDILEYNYILMSLYRVFLTLCNSK